MNQNQIILKTKFLLWCCTQWEELYQEIDIEKNQLQTVIPQKVGAKMIFLSCALIILTIQFILLKIKRKYVGNIQVYHNNILNLQQSRRKEHADVGRGGGRKRVKNSLW